MDILYRRLFGFTRWNLSAEFLTRPIQPGIVPRLPD